MIIGTVVTRLDVPGEPGEWVEIRKLSHKALAQAAQARSETGLAAMRALGSDLLLALQQARTAAPDDSAAATDAAAGYDRDVVLQRGVVRWSYGVPVAPDALADLDEATARWLASEIVGRSLAPPSAESVGNATAPSPAS